MRLWVFNPETDFALGNGQKNYTAPRNVVELRRSMALLPLCAAAEDDFILLLDPPLQPHPKAISLESLRDFAGQIEEVIPWGWNHSLRRTLLHHGLPSGLLPTEEQLDDLRDLAHRRTTIPFLKQIMESTELPLVTSAPMEMFHYEPCDDSFLKAPWSSSGRGVLSAKGKSAEAIRKWCEGTIKRQGSYMREKALVKRLDFASEWMVSREKVRFLGLSLFETNDNGKYQNNNNLSQPQIVQKICSAAQISSLGLRKILVLQRRAIRNLIAPRYRGPLGIDMLVAQTGENSLAICPCIELNLRYTMGMRAILNSLQEKTPIERIFGF